MRNIHISDLILERYVLKELPENKLKELGEIIEHSPDLLDRINKIERSNADILNKYPKDDIAADINQRLKNQQPDIKYISGERRVYKRFMLPSLGLVAAAMAIIFLIPAVRNPHDIVYKGTPEIILEKGNKADIYIYRKNNHAVDILTNDSSAKKGDLLQIAYVSKEKAYGIILSIDGRGTVTLHYPANKSGATELKQGKKILLDNSYELDDAPGFERFFFITSSSKLNVNTVLQAAQNLALIREKIRIGKIELSNKMSDGTDQISILIKKEK